MEDLTCLFSCLIIFYASLFTLFLGGPLSSELRSPAHFGVCPQQSCFILDSSTKLEKGHPPAGLNFVLALRDACAGT
jgi:hypothetical protein